MVQCLSGIIKSAWQNLLGQTRPIWSSCSLQCPDIIILPFNYSKVLITCISESYTFYTRKRERKRVIGRWEMKQRRWGGWGKWIWTKHLKRAHSFLHIYTHLIPLSCLGSWHSETAVRHPADYRAYYKVKFITSVSVHPCNCLLQGEGQEGVITYVCMLHCILIRDGYRKFVLFLYDMTSNICILAIFLMFHGIGFGVLSNWKLSDCEKATQF